MATLIIYPQNTFEIYTSSFIMGIKELWSILTPHCDRKPIYELRGKTVAIDLAGWVCESLNVVDYFVHPRNHLKNLFFRTCYLICEEVIPVFVLEGTAPTLKKQVMSKRKDIQFRGVKPKEKANPHSQQKHYVDNKNSRTGFNHILRQCETLLTSMGILCVQGPGEAEAYCAFLNKTGLCDGVISQDSDCFAYGAIRVYRNFSVSSQGAASALGGAVDIYDMQKICESMDFGRNKIIVMALLCGCDYCPDGIGGIGRDGVIRLFNMYNEEEILNKLRSWRHDAKYTELEMRVNDKAVCVNCGHLGKTQNHLKNGCGICRTSNGCDETLWKEKRLSIKTELTFRKKAISYENFPSEDIIKEFLSEPSCIPNIHISWKQPNLVKFIKQVGALLQWTEIYCFQKCLPILTRWQVHNVHNIKQTPTLAYLIPSKIIKKRILKGVSSLEVLWKDEHGFFDELIPEVQINEFIENNINGLQDLWSTIEPLNLMELSYNNVVQKFWLSKNTISQKKNKPIKCSKAPKSTLVTMDNFILKKNNVESKKTECGEPIIASKTSTLQLTGKMFKKNRGIVTDINRYYLNSSVCSTPKKLSVPICLVNKSNESLNLSDVIEDLTKKKSIANSLKIHGSKMLRYEHTYKKISVDDMLVNTKMSFSECSSKMKKSSLDDSFDIFVNKIERRKLNISSAKNLKKIRGDSNISLKNEDMHDLELGNSSYFFNPCFNTEDEFEKIMDLNSLCLDSN